MTVTYWISTLSRYFLPIVYNFSMAQIGSPRSVQLSANVSISIVVTKDGFWISNNKACHSSNFFSFLSTIAFRIHRFLSSSFLSNNCFAEAAFDCWRREETSWVRTAHLSFYPNFSSSKNFSISVPRETNPNAENTFYSKINSFCKFSGFCSR